MNMGADLEKGYIIMKNFSELCRENKVLFFLSIANKALQYIKRDEQAKIVKAALECCWDQMINNNYNGEIIYDFLDNEENGITILAEMSEDEKESAAWNCIIDALAFTSRYAYDARNAKYYPEPISLVDDKLVEHLINCYIKCTSERIYINDLLILLSENNQQSIAELKKQIDSLS